MTAEHETTLPPGYAWCRECAGLIEPDLGCRTCGGQGLVYAGPRAVATWAVTRPLPAEMAARASPRGCSWPSRARLG